MMDRVAEARDAAESLERLAILVHELVADGQWGDAQGKAVLAEIEAGELLVLCRELARRELPREESRA